MTEFSCVYLQLCCFFDNFIFLYWFLSCLSLCFVMVFFSFFIISFSLFFVFLYSSIFSSSFSISSGFVTSWAIPSLISLFVPIPLLSPISCGIANIFFSCSFAILAVTLVPLLYFASITSIPNAIPLTILFLSKNFSELASSFGGYSLMISPPSFIIFLYSCMFSFGYILFNPFPNTAIVFPLFFSVELCAAVSIPLC